MKIYSTRDMESALQALALIFPHVVFRRVYNNKHYIPLRMTALTGVDWFFYSPARPQVSAQQLMAWHTGRGILVNTHETTSLRRPIGPHDALLLPECPTSQYRLEAESRETARCVVIYEPPTWREHEMTMKRQSPSAQDCRAAYNLMQHCKEPIDDEALQKGAGIECTISAVRHLLYQHAGLKVLPPVLPVRLHYRPDENAEQTKFYDWLLRFPIETINGYRHVPELDLLAYSHRWRSLLRELKKQHAVEKKGMLYRYEFHSVPPNWEMVNRHHRMLCAEFERVREILSRAPVFPHLEILSGQFEYESI